MGRSDMNVDSLVVRRNLFTQMHAGLSATCDGDAIILSRASRVDVNNNTFDGIEGRALRAGLYACSGIGTEPGRERFPGLRCGA